MEWTHKNTVIKVGSSGRFLVIDGHASRHYDTLAQAKAAIDLDHAGAVYWFPWGTAKIGIIGCRKDVAEVIDALRTQEGD